MLDELRTRFRTRFIDTARGRIRRILILLGQPSEIEELAAELHALAGEAAMLGLDEISATARRGEDAARSWHHGQSSAQVRCARDARLLGQLVERFASGPASGAPRAEDVENAGSNAEPHLRAASAGSDDIRPRPRVLVVDDSTLIGAELIDALLQVDIEAISAGDRTAALQALDEFEPDLVLVDVYLPGEQPGALCQALRDATDSKLVVVLMSGRRDSELATLADTVAADGYVSKQKGRAAVVGYVEHRLARGAGL